MRLHFGKKKSAPRNARFPKRKENNLCMQGRTRGKNLTQSSAECFIHENGVHVMRKGLEIKINIQVLCENCGSLTCQSIFLTIFLCFGIYLKTSFFAY